jgi:hypothetical protein
MIEAIVTFSGNEARQEVYEILTYLRGEGYWQFLCLDGTLKIIPETSIEMVEIVNTKANPSQDANK